MSVFDFMSGGMQGQPQAYSQFQQPQDYSQVLAGGQAGNAATQGLDFSKIGDWATQMAQKTQFAQNPASANFQGVLQGGQAMPTQGPSYQQALAALNSQQANPQQTDMAAYRQPAYGGGRAPQAGGGQVQQGAAGYIGNGSRLGLLGMVR